MLKSPLIIKVNFKAISVANKRNVTNSQTDPSYNCPKNVSILQVRFFFTR